MRTLLLIAKFIDRLNDWFGRFAYACALIVVLVGCFNTIARYTARFTGTDLSSNAYLELQWYLFSLLFLLGAAYTLRHDAHVRVDILYARCSPRTRAWIDLAGTLLFLLPFCVLMIWVSVPSVINSWQIMETSPDPGGLVRYPIKTMIPLAFLLLLIQGASQLIKAVAVLRGATADQETRTRSLEL